VYLDQWKATTAVTSSFAFLSELYRACTVDEIEPITYLIQAGSAFLRAGRDGPGERLLVSAIAMAYETPKTRSSTSYRQVRDLGLMAQRLAQQEKRAWPPLSSSPPAGCTKSPH